MRIAAFAWESLKKSRTLAEFIQAKSDCVRCVWYSNNDSIALAQRELNQPQRSTFTYFCHRHSSIFFLSTVLVGDSSLFFPLPF